MTKQTAGVMEIEIEKAARTLADMEIELLAEFPDSEKLKSQATEIVNRGLRLLRCVERDKTYFRD